jgi:hypothetical protein
MKQPSLAIHSHDVPGYKYQMRWTRYLAPKATAHDVVSAIRADAYHPPQLGLENVIINSHGGPGVLAVGGNGASDPQIDSSNVGVFARLHDTDDVGTIWLVGCEVAAGTAGKNFCSALARASGCEVVAGDVDQYVNFGYYLRAYVCRCAWGGIDDFEGTAYRFYPDGGYTWYSYNGKRFAG